MAHEWKIPDDKKPYCEQQPPTTPTPPTCPSGKTDICDVILSPVFQQCHDVIPAQPFFEACKFDVCHMPNISIGCSSLEAYAGRCAAAGVCINWRNSTNGRCELRCPKTKVYKACGSSIQPTCNSRYPSHSHLNPISFSSHSHFIPISFSSHSNLIPISFPYHSFLNLILISFPSHSLLILIPISFSSHSHLILISTPSHSHLILISFPSYSHLILISIPSHSHLIPVSFSSHSHLILILISFPSHFHLIPISFSSH
uniref:VWF/SSPO/Zonadhesin-like cysteine-rich domain-containing protein n=1 Tax=Hucho hucho TaxID=62062 RepID=A0A4W5Q4W5_9TELE